MFSRRVPEDIFSVFVSNVNLFPLSDIDRASVPQVEVRNGACHKKAINIEKTAPLSIKVTQTERSDYCPIFNKMINKNDKMYNNNREHI